MCSTRGLLDPETHQKVATITAVFTFMEIIPPDDALALDITEHHLSNKLKPPAEKGMISVPATPSRRVHDRSSGSRKHDSGCPLVSPVDASRPQRSVLPVRGSAAQQG
jgi:hypothetical protein